MNSLYTASEVRREKIKSIRDSVKTIYANVTLAMLDHGIDVETVREVTATANSCLEGLSSGELNLKDVTETLENDHHFHITWLDEEDI